MSTEETTETDQLDSVLQAMEPGLLFTVNDVASESLDVMTSKELRVTSSAADETRVEAKSRNGVEYRVFRDWHGDLVYAVVEPDGTGRTHDVVSLEIVGIDD